MYAFWEKNQGLQYSFSPWHICIQATVKYFTAKVEYAFEICKYSSKLKIYDSELVVRIMSIKIYPNIHFLRKVQNIYTPSLNILILTNEEVRFISRFTGLCIRSYSKITLINRDFFVKCFNGGDKCT